MDIDNQYMYWDKVAATKTFTHPVNTTLLSDRLGKNAVIVDFGCGYGRIVQELLSAGFSSIRGYDTSAELIARGKLSGLPIHHIISPGALPVADQSVDCILLFAVLTCIPSNRGQIDLMAMLYSKLKPGGILYISDYYLQENEVSKSRYTYLQGDPTNFGVFTLSEGVTFRHHTRGWIARLLQNFHGAGEQLVEVKTMNGSTAKAFQMIVKK